MKNFLFLLKFKRKKYNSLTRALDSNYIGYFLVMTIRSNIPNAKHKQKTKQYHFFFEHINGNTSHGSIRSQLRILCLIMLP